MSEDLFVDLGNSRIKWMSASGQVQQAVEYTERGLHGVLDRVWGKRPQPGRIWLATVASTESEHMLRDWIQQHWRKQPRIIPVQSSACGVSCGYVQPEQLGVDRWMAIIAAHKIFPAGVCVVDCGTATTLDVVDDRGNHLGGYILPGLQMMHQSLLQGTAMRPAGEFMDALEWGNSTASCIHLGIRKSLLALIEQSVERLQAAGVCDPGLVLTGGASSLITSHLQLAFEQRESLVLEGMMIFVQEDAG
ncbi:type III pantothenate kinase [Thiolapillus sp.]